MATKYIVDNLTGQTITGSIYSPNITGAITNLPSQVTANTTNDVYFLSGIFINSDVSTGTTQFESYVVVNSVMKYVFGSGWSDITVDYMSGLPID